MIDGFATSAGTARFRDRFPALANAGHFRQPQAPGARELWLSSIGLGTYLGETDVASDLSYTQSVLQSLRAGINVLDTAINYRHQRSERNIGSAIQQLIDSGKLQRDEILVCTKAGYLPFDAELPADQRDYLRREYVETGVAPTGEIAGGMHCMAASYLDDQLERSRRNTGLSTVDVFYLHNPESQLGYISADAFRDRLRNAFRWAEDAIKDKRIRWYGVATWNGLRVAPGDRSYMNLEQILETARGAGGNDHHFRFVQLPLNLAMTEAYGLGNQTLRGERGSVLSLAEQYGIAVVASATLHQGQLTRGVPDKLKEIMGLDADAETAIQFVRSAPSLTTALIGMSRPDHVLENMKVASRPLMTIEEWEGLFSPAES
jgi:aryl-alcohol dehydrogenase-like predicted oxidoreductase